jgi:type VI secretion system protein ImpF
MADSTPSERIQPCLLDRLTDDEPGKQEESRSQRVISHQKYKRGVLRDLEWLFNTNAYLQLRGFESFHLSEFPEAYRSVLNYGTRQLCGLTAPDMDKLQREMTEALRTFEPRISSHGLVVQTDIERNLVTFEVNGQLWANPLPEQLHLKTIIDLETEQCLLGDASSHG